MNKSRFSIIHITLIVLTTALITIGITVNVMNSKVNALNGELQKQVELSNDYSDLMRANEDAAYHYEKEYALEKERSKKLEEQLKKCCPNYKVED